MTVVASNLIESVGNLSQLRQLNHVEQFCVVTFALALIRESIVHKITLNLFCKFNWLMGSRDEEISTNTGTD